MIIIINKRKKACLHNSIILTNTPTLNPLTIVFKTRSNIKSSEKQTMYWKKVFPDNQLKKKKMNTLNGNT
jgi:hypothetical protein